MFIPNNIKIPRPIRYFLGITIFGIVVFLAYMEIKNYGRSLIEGPDLYDEMALPITYELMDSIKTGLSKYKYETGKYPKYVGKYFYEDIKKYVQIDRHYLFVDSIAKNGDTVNVKLYNKYVPDNNKHYSIYISIGDNKLTFIYRYINDNSYLLYSVGKNRIDERGRGDDIVNMY